MIYVLKNMLVQEEGTDPKAYHRVYRKERAADV